MKKGANIVTNVKAEQEKRRMFLFYRRLDVGDKSSLLVKLTFVSRMSLKLYADQLPQSSLLLLVNELPPSFDTQQAQYIT
jgi:hypothetical protein